MEDPRKMKSFLVSTKAVFLKDWRSELRTRYALSALVMFVLTTIAIIVFAFGGESPSQEVLAGVLWVIIFFSGMSGLARTFVAEEERGTSLTLQLLSTPTAVLFGKLAFNVVLIIIVNTLAVLLFLFFFSTFRVSSVGLFVTTLALGSIGLASASTIIAAIIARANTKGSLFPVLSLPLLLPLLMTVIHATSLSSEGAFFSEGLDDFRILVSYIGAVTGVSYILFDYVWKD